MNELRMNDNPRTYWIILNENVDEFGRRISFNTQIKDESKTFHLWKTRKWARKVARENDNYDARIYRTILPVGARYAITGEKEIEAETIVVRDDKIYTPDGEIFKN